MRTDIRPDGTVSPGEVTTVDMKLEVVVIPVSDVDRAMRVTTRFPGRVDGDTTLASARDLAQALERAAAAHGDQGTPSTRLGGDWADRYAEYLVREQSGKQPPT